MGFKAENQNNKRKKMKINSSWIAPIEIDISAFILAISFYLVAKSFYFAVQ